MADPYDEAYGGRGGPTQWNQPAIDDTTQGGVLEQLGYGFGAHREKEEFTKQRELYIGAVTQRLQGLGTERAAGLAEMLGKNPNVTNMIIGGGDKWPVIYDKLRTEAHHQRAAELTNVYLKRWPDLSKDKLYQLLIANRVPSIAARAQLDLATGPSGAERVARGRRTEAAEALDRLPSNMSLTEQARRLRRLGFTEEIINNAVTRRGVLRNIDQPDMDQIHEILASDPTMSKTEFLGNALSADLPQGTIDAGMKFMNDKSGAGSGGLNSAQLRENEQIRADRLEMLSLRRQFNIEPAELIKYLLPHLEQEFLNIEKIQGSDLSEGQKKALMLMHPWWQKSKRIMHGGSRENRVKFLQEIFGDKYFPMDIPQKPAGMIGSEAGAL